MERNSEYNKYKLTSGDLISMQSAKQGKTQSRMGGIGSAAAGITGAIWTIFSAGMGAPWPVTIVGVMLLIAAIIIAFINATRKSR
jgi:uncharacterized integral membrane protein